MLSSLKYEVHLALVATRLFGLRKGILFIITVPAVIFTRRNRTAYNNMGQCKMKVNGEIITFPHPDVRFIEEIILKSCYTPDANFQIDSDFVVIDAGANIGVFTVPAALRAKGGRVFAIEPASENFRFLKENIEANKLENVVFLNEAISDTTGMIRLHVTNPGNSSIYESTIRDRPTTTETCQSITMNDLLRIHSIGRVDFLKMDIEGAEFAALRDPAWLERVDRIVLEVHLDKGDIHELMKTLSTAGFVVTTSPAYDEDCAYVYGRRIAG
jgi:FkbM family methyltransferase